MTEPINRKELSDALKFADQHWPHTVHDNAKTIISAARAHLATLPEPPKTKIIDVGVSEWAYKNDDDEWLPQRSIFREEAMLLSWLKSNRLADKSHFYYGRNYQSQQEVPDED